MTTNENRPPTGNRQGGGRKETNGHTQHSITGGRGQTVYAEDGRAVFGKLCGDVFSKYVHSAQGHMMLKPRGWALDTWQLEAVKAAGAAAIVIEDRDTGFTYRAGVADFEAKGVTVNRGYGAQVCLPLRYWSVDGEPPLSLAVRNPAPDSSPDIAPAAVQLALL